MHERPARARSSRRLRALCAGLALGADALIGASAASLTGRINASVQDFGATRESNGGPIQHQPLDDSSTTGLDSTYDNASLYVHSVMHSTLSAGTLAIGARTSATSAAGSGKRLGVQGGGIFDFADEILIQSSILPAGTPVELLFSFHSASFATLAHDAFGVPGAGYLNGNGSSARYLFSGSLSARDAGNASVDSASWAAADNRYLHSENLFAPHLTTGIFDPQTPQLDFLVTGEVGGRVLLNFRLEAYIGVGVWSSGVGNLDVHHGSTEAALAMAFGGSSLLTGVTLESALYGGTFSAASQANLANANQALSSFTPVPVPAMAWPFTIGLLGLLGAASRRISSRVVHD